MSAIGPRPDLKDVLRRAVQAGTDDLHVAIPARVESFDAATGRASVKPLVKEVLEIGGKLTPASVPVIPGVPVVFPGAGGFRITFPVVAGDTVLLVFAERSLDVWLSGGGEVDPVDPRRHALSDAIAIPGLRDFAHPWKGNDSGAITIGKDGGTAQPAALGQDVRDELDALWTALEGHTHGGVLSGTAFTGSASASTPPTVRTGKTKPVKSGTVKVTT